MAPSRIVFFLLGVLLASCSSGSRVSVMVTDIPEMALYAELYNASQGSYRISTEFHPDPGSRIRYSQNIPDLLVSRNLSPLGNRDKFTTLDFVFGRASQSQDNFYPGLLDMGKAGSSQILLPICFNLPVILGLKTTFSSELSGLWINFPDIEAFSVKFNKPNRNPPNLGYSLRWGEDQMASILFRYKVDIRYPMGGPLNWNEDALTQALGFLGKSRENNATVFEDQFTSKYLPGHGFRLLTDNRILFYPSDLKNYLNLPVNQSAQLDFRYPAMENRVMALSHVVFLGIPSQGKSREAAEDFSSWLLRTKTQIEILDYGKKNQVKSFGIAGGLSSLRDVSEKYIPEADTRLIGLIPPGNAIEFPPPLPAEWNILYGELIYPWLNKKLQNSEYPSLTDVYLRWEQERKR